MNALVIGGSSGLGLELAVKLLNQNYSVTIIGRADPKVSGLNFKEFDLRRGRSLAEDIKSLVNEIPKPDIFIYAAGFYQKGLLTDLEPDEISNMLDVGLNALIWFCRELLIKNSNLPNLVVISSTSQDRPKLQEPIYAATKSAIKQLTNSLSLDPRIGKALLVAPAGMKTEFWRMTGHDVKEYNDPTWVADETLKLLDINFNYLEALILRSPPTTKIVEKR